MIKKSEPSKNLYIPMPKIYKHKGKIEIWWSLILSWNKGIIPLFFWQSNLIFFNLIYWYSNIS